MSKEARFRTLLVSERIPHTAGLCLLCLREMWTNLPEKRERRGVLSVSSDGVTCETCARFRREQDGADPRDHKGSPAERIPAERVEDDPWWRPLAACSGSDTELFAPDPMPDERTGRRTAVWTQRRYIAALVCGRCPVAQECRQAALTYGYEGLWGGRFFNRNTWVDPLNGVRGPTQFASAPVRRRMVERLAEQGYDPDGELIDEEDVA